MTKRLVRRLLEEPLERLRHLAAAGITPRDLDIIRPRVRPAGSWATSPTRHRRRRMNSALLLLAPALGYLVAGIVCTARRLHRAPQSPCGGLSPWCG